jgi:hypothetical protein
MAETVLRTILCLVSVVSFPIVITSPVASVTFVGFLNDLRGQQSHFSALLEVDLSLPSNGDYNRDQWLATQDGHSCSGMAVYGPAQVDPPTKAQRSSGLKTVQLVLPLVHHEASSESRTLYLCHGSQHLGPASKFHLPKVTSNHVLNDDDDEDEYILETFDDNKDDGE